MDKEDKVEVAKEDSKTFLVEHVIDTDDTSKQNEEVNKSVENNKKKDVATNSTQPSKKLERKTNTIIFGSICCKKKIELKISQDKTLLNNPLKNTEIEKLSSSQKKDPSVVQKNSFDKHV